MDIIFYGSRTKECLEMAAQLGEKTPIVVFTKHEDVDLKAKKALLVKNPKEAQKYKYKYDHILALANRENLENKSIDLVYGAEAESGKDKMHHRRGLNQVLAKLVASTGKTYLFSLELLKERSAERLGRMKQNKILLDKYKAKTAVCSFAIEPLDLRAPRERKLFLDEL